MASQFFRIRSGRIVKPNVFQGGLCLLCVAAKAENTLDHSTSLGTVVWGLCSRCAGSRIAQVWQAGSNFIINGTALENIMVRRKIDRSHSPGPNDKLVITRQELGGMIDACLYAAKAAHKRHDEDAEARFMDTLAGVRKSLGRPADDEGSWEDDDEDLDWGDDDEAAATAEDDEDLGWEDDEGDEEWDF